MPQKKKGLGRESHHALAGRFTRSISEQFKGNRKRSLKGKPLTKLSVTSFSKSPLCRW